MNSKKFLIFDFGASNGRAIVAKYNGKKIDMDVLHRFDNTPVQVGNTLYWDILRLFSELKIGLQKSVNKYSGIISLGIDMWGADFGIIDRNGKLISNPVHYRDEQRIKDSQELLKIIPSRELFNLTGYWINPIYDIFQLFSMKINDAPDIVHGEKYLALPDLFNYFLSGITVNEKTRASTSTMYNQKEKKWETGIFEKLEISGSLFSKIILPGQKLGSITSQICTELAVSPMDIIAPATHDTASAVAGIPIIDTGKNWAFLSMGTWCILGKETSGSIINDEVYDSGFANEAGVENTNLLFKNINGLWIVQQCRNNWIFESGRDISWDEIVELARVAKPFKSFIDPDNEIFVKAKPNMPALVADWCKNTAQAVPGGIGETARCIYESLALKFRYNMEILNNLLKQKIELMHLVGGGTQNKLLCQWASNACRVPVIAGPTETTSIGNVIMQLKAIGEISCTEEGRKISFNSSRTDNYQPEDIEKWNEAYQRFLKLL